MTPKETAHGGIKLKRERKNIASWKLPFWRLLSNHCTGINPCHLHSQTNILK